MASVRAGEDSAFEELYRRYRPRVTAFVRRFLRDDVRAEDVAQEAFMSALRRMRVTDREIAFKPWIYEIARNAAIDAHRRSRRNEEVPMEALELLRPSDRLRLLGRAAPESALVARERMDYLRAAFEELSDTHHRVLVMRELEGRSYREIAERMELTRPAVESALFRARRRLERLYEELQEGRRCEAVLSAIARLLEGVETADDRRRVARHVRRCPSCRRKARELRVGPLGRMDSVRAKAAALLPLPFLFRARPGKGTFGPAAAQGTQAVGGLAERTAALLAAAALATAGATFVQERLAPGRQAQPAAVEPAPGQGFGIPRLVLPPAPPAPAHPPRHRRKTSSKPADGGSQSAVPTGSRTAPTPPIGTTRPPSPPAVPAAGAQRVVSQKASLGSSVTSDVDDQLSSADTVLNAVTNPPDLPRTLAGVLHKLATRSPGPQR